MDQLSGFAQQYIQAPWRKQLQIIGMFALVLVLVALVALLYLNISARATRVGREIQFMQDDIEGLDLEIEDMYSNLSMILSAEEMEKRAIKQDFVPLGSDDVLYLKVSGYVERHAVVLAPISDRSVQSASVKPVEYTESLLDWLERRFQKYYMPLAEVWYE
jgi:cell division protein FtsL